MLDILYWNQGLQKSFRLAGKTRAKFWSFYKALQFNSMEALTPLTAFSLAKWADEYHVEALKAKCEEFLSTQTVNGLALEHAVKYCLEKRTRLTRCWRRQSRF